MTSVPVAGSPPREGLGRRLSTFFYRHPRVRLWALLALPLAWLVLVYFGSHILTSLLNHPGRSGVPISQSIAEAIPFPGPPQLVWTLLLVAFWAGLAMLLHRHRIYVRP